MKLQYIFYLLSLCAADLEIKRYNEIPLYVCKVLLSSTVLYTEPDKDGFQDYCDPDNINTLGSISHCLIENFKDDPVYIEEFLKSCKGDISVEQFYNGYDESKSIITPPPPGSDKRSGSYSLPVGVYSEPVPYDLPIQFKQEITDIQLEANWKQAQQTNYSLWFGLVLILYWLAVMMVSAIGHWSYWLVPGLVKSSKGKFINAFRSHFVLAPTLTKHHAKPKSKGTYFGYYVPLRFETIALIGWFILCVVFLAAEIHPRGPSLVAFSVGLRTGVLIIFAMPLLILFPGRNNFLQYVTGWSFSRFITLHRWIGRILFLLLVVHAITFTIALFKMEYYYIWFEEAWLRWGAVGIAAASLIVITSFQFFRKRLYELFVILHIALVVVFIIGGWIHSEPRGEKYLIPFYVSVAVWAFDRFVRLLRLLSYGVQKANIELINEDTLKIIANRPSWWTPHPGAHAFVHILTPYHFWQSHPFTLIDSVEEPNTISFYVKVKNGITKEIKNQLLEKLNNRDSYRVIVEGPYSQQLPLRKFENVVFLAGGNGIPGLYYEARKLIENSSSRLTTRRVKFYWVIRDLNSIDWFYPELLRFKDTMIDVIVYVTRPEKGEENFNPEQEETTSESSSYLNVPNKFTTTKSITDKVSMSDIQQNLHFVEFREGRPNVPEIVLEEVHLSEKAVAFTVCANEVMVDETRLAVRNILGKDTSKRIDYFEEIQGW